MLQPVRRRRRRRRRGLRWWLVLVVALVALAVGFVLGGRDQPRATVLVPSPSPFPLPSPALGAASLQALAPALVKRQRLVFGPPVVRRPVALSAPTGIVIDARTGRVLWAKRPHERRQIASTTKIMTALLALRRLRPHDLVTVPPEAPRVPLVREGLRTGERVQAWKLFYGLLLYSGNDDALTLAVAAGGTKRRFIEEMNAEAKRLGLRDTHFASTSGVIDDQNHSSVWDLAALTRVAMRNVRFRTIVRRERIEVPWSAPTFAKVYVNKNLLLSLYAGATGVKTGYTQRSGPCIVASATRHGVSLIAVVLDSRNKYADAARLLSLGFRTPTAA